jgi:DNA-binding transcriptional MerR regulator
MSRNPARRQELEAFAKDVAAEVLRREGADADHPPSARTVRYYQAKGCLSAPEREGRVPLYGDRQFLEMLAIRTLQRAGVSLSEIRSQLVNATDERLEKLASARTAAKDPIEALDFSSLSAADRKAELARVMKRLDRAEPRPRFLTMVRLAITPHHHLFTTPGEMKRMTEARARDIAFAVYATLLDRDITRVVAKGAVDED